MITEVVKWLEENYGHWPGAGLFNFITFRASLAIIFSLIISILFGGRIIRYLNRKQVGETVRDLGLSGQKIKEGTPTMGGIIIILSIVIPCLLLGDITNIYLLLMLISTLWMAIIGFIDDYIKVFKKNKEGLKGWFKIAGQVVLGLLISITMLVHEDIFVRLDKKTALEIGLDHKHQIAVSLEKGKGDYKTNLTNVPFFRENRLDYSQLWINNSPSRILGWIIFIPLVIFIITAVSNASNLTDGLDGLATGISGIIGVVLGIFAYLSGNAITANYLNILHLPGSGELVIFSASFIGACIGFLWHNTYPARVFMGDTGSLALGGIIASLAILLRKELLIPVLCGVFFIETLSVMIQVSYFKYTKKKYGEGRRILLMSPLHHHYQKKGMHEVTIVTRFWIIAILLAVLTIITLKIR
ncbi:MAG: Phospho-N-acetylmuramoyl-pentapeptide-transferase [Bacteroidota bacterium]|jgi:phospho-N-acetylmuramoyl-pentapeptide-transferase